MNHKLIEVINL